MGLQAERIHNIPVCRYFISFTNKEELCRSERDLKRRSVTTVFHYNFTFVDFKGGGSGQQKYSQSV